MPRGSRRTSYVRDGRGRFASTPGGGAPKRPPAKRVSRGTNRLTRDNSGRITSVGGNGATARGGRLRTGAGNLRATQTDRLKGAPKGVVSRGGKVRATAAKKPVGWMQSPEARKDRVDPMSAANRKDYARRLRALPKAAQRAIQVERSARKRKFFVAGNTAAQLSNLSEGRMQLIANVGKRKNKLTPGQIDAITRSMSQSARRLKVGMAMGRRGRMKYNPNALQIATGAAARKIRGARVGGVVRKGKASTKPQTFNDALKKANPAAYEKLQKREAKVAKAQQRKAAKLANRNSASAPTGSADARARRSARLSGVSGRIAGRARRIYAQQGERVGAGTLPNRGLFAAPMGRRSTGSNAATSGLQPGRKARGARPSGTIAKPRGMKPGAGKAPKRISYLLAYHGTNKESATAIRAGGYKETRYGTYGAGVYATTSRKAAREYASWRAAGGKNRFGEAFPASALGPAVLTHRIPKTKVNRNDTRAAFNNMAAREWVQSGRARKLSKEWTNHFPYVVMNEQLANRTLVNRSGTIRRPRKPRRNR